MISVNGIAIERSGRVVIILFCILEVPGLNLGLEVSLTEFIRFSSFPPGRYRRENYPSIEN
jgi:hypothetical protein